VAVHGRLATGQPPMTWEERIEIIAGILYLIGFLMLFYDLLIVYGLIQ
jgi:hypothetical protein